MISKKIVLELTVHLAFGIEVGHNKNPAALQISKLANGSKLAVLQYCHL